LERGSVICKGSLHQTGRGSEEKTVFPSDFKKKKFCRSHQLTQRSGRGGRPRREKGAPVQKKQDRTKKDKKKKKGRTVVGGEKRQNRQEGKKSLLGSRQS